MWTDIQHSHDLLSRVEYADRLAIRLNKAAFTDWQFAQRPNKHLPLSGHAAGPSG